MLETLKITREGGVVLVQIDRPKQLNALNAKLLEEVISELTSLPALSGCPSAIWP